MPPYRHVPGLTPHPVKDPLGHLHGYELPGPSDACGLLPATWRECPEYLYGVDLFNRAFLWEAHEAWELVWIAAGKQSQPGQFVQGLIQVAAALLRSHLGTPVGSRSLLTKAWGRWSAAEVTMRESGGGAYMGVSVLAWKRAVEAYVTAPRRFFPFIVLKD